MLVGVRKRFLEVLRQAGVAGKEKDLSPHAASLHSGYGWTKLLKDLRSPFLQRAGADGYIEVARLDERRACAQCVLFTVRWPTQGSPAFPMGRSPGLPRASKF